MSVRITLAVAARVLTELRRDRRTLALVLLMPSALVTLLWWTMSGATGERFDATAPALLAVFPVTVMFLVASVTTLRERSAGTLERLLAMPMSKLDFVLGYALAFGALALAQSSIAVLLCVEVLGLDLRGALVAVLVTAVADALLGTSLGLFVSAFARTEFQAVQFLPALLLPQLLLCGLFVPRAALPQVLRGVSDALPLSYAVEAMDRAVSGADPSGLVRDVAVVLAFVVACLVLGAATLRRRTP
ncbi:ABC transporter permease [soil metagenome]